MGDARIEIWHGNRDGSFCGVFKLSKQLERDKY